MNHVKYYNLLINKARSRPNIDGAKEIHHVVPRCMSGSDNSDNLVALTYREHYVAHLLLTYIHGGDNWTSLLLMSNLNKSLPSKIFAKAKLRAKINEKCIRYQCDECELISNLGGVKTHQRFGGHKGITKLRKKTSPLVSKSYVRQPPKPAKTGYQCKRCGKISTLSGLYNHQRSSKHRGILHPL